MHPYWFDEGVTAMSARSLLNAASLNGAMVMASLLGLLTGSFLVGVLSFVACVVVAVVGGEIRFPPSGRR